MSALFQQMSMENDHQNRYRNQFGEHHLKSIIRRFLSKHHQDSEDLIQRGLSSNDPLGVVANGSHRTIDVLNGVFAAARLPVEIAFTEAGLRARRSGTEYGIDKMSDGERAALLLVGSILVRPHGTLIAIDEPERHLNPSISGPLLAAAVRARPDLSYVIATHDLSVSASISNKTIIHVVDSFVVPQAGFEVRRYELVSVDDVESLQEDLHVSILGSRRSLLFVEGNDGGFDRALFSCIYPEHSVVGRGGWEAVANDVRSLRSNLRFHRFEISGLVDGDGRGAKECEKLSGDAVFVLPTPTVENLFFHPVVMSQMAKEAHAFRGGDSADQRMEAALNAALEHVERHADDIVDKRVVWRVNRMLSERKISAKDVRALANIEAIDIAKVVAIEEEAVRGIIGNRDANRQLWSMPLKNTGVPSAVCKALGYTNFAEYKAAVVRHLEAKSISGELILRALREVLPEIAPASQAPTPQTDAAMALT